MLQTENELKLLKVILDESHTIFTAYENVHIRGMGARYFTIFKTNDHHLLSSLSVNKLVCYSVQ